MFYFRIFLTLILFTSCMDNPPTSINWESSTAFSFLRTQRQFPRVRNAFEKNEAKLFEQLQQKNIDPFNFNIYLRAFKAEEILEVWAKSKTDQQYSLLTSYPFCKNSGSLGPKRKEGDRQIPEGIYKLSHYNPKSSYHLSLRVNYPNASDLILSDPTQPGSDIYIHGACQTVGCIPITDEKIEELYLLAVLAKNEIAIPIHIFPFKMETASMENAIRQNPQHELFWKSLKPAYDFFEENYKLPSYTIDTNGLYRISGSD